MGTTCADSQKGLLIESIVKLEHCVLVNRSVGSFSFAGSSSHSPAIPSAHPYTEPHDHPATIQSSLLHCTHRPLLISVLPNLGTSLFFPSCSHPAHLPQDIKTARGNPYVHGGECKWYTKEAELPSRWYLLSLVLACQQSLVAEVHHFRTPRYYQELLGIEPQRRAPKTRIKSGFVNLLDEFGEDPLPPEPSPEAHDFAFAGVEDILGGDGDEGPAAETSSSSSSSSGIDANLKHVECTHRQA